MLAAVAVAAALAGTPPAICEYRPPQPPLSAAERTLRRHIDYRRAYGFRSSRRYVRRLLADPANLRRSPWESLDVVLTPREAKYLRERFRLQDDRVTRRVDRYLRRHAHDLGTTSLEDDYPRRPYLQVRVTRDLARHRAALRRRASFRLRVDRVRYSERELERFEDSIDEDVLSAEGIEVITSETGIDVIVLEVATPRTDAAAVVRRLYGPVVRVRVLGPSPTVPDCSSPESYRLDPDGRTLHLIQVDSGSVPPRTVEVIEREDAVQVGVVSDQPYGPVTADAFAHRISVTLAAPLGDREVRSIVTRKPVPRRLRR